MSIYKACDIRGKFGTELVPEHATRLGRAAAQLVGPGQILVGGDGRRSTPVLKDALISALLAGGSEVTDLGVLPTPAFYFARDDLGIHPGIMVTASHNPAEYNGFKIILGKLPITEPEIEQVRALMESPLASCHGQPGTLIHANTIQSYAESRSSLAPDLLGMKVVVDCSDGMAALVAEQLWRTTGATVHFINAVVDGAFPHHPPNPADSRNMSQLAHEVVIRRADLGVQYDGDADRVGFVDNLGSPALPDKTIAIFAASALDASGPAPIVFDQKCSRLVPEIIARHGGKPIREKSGHTFIKTAFIQNHAPYAGELSGHHFFRAIQGDDGAYASMMLSEIILKRGASLSALEAELPDYSVTPDLRVPLTPAEMDSVLIELERHFRSRGVVETRDGVRVELPNGWGMARRSVTEPLLTLRFEGTSPGALQDLIAEFIRAAPELSGKLPRE